MKMEPIVKKFYDALEEGKLMGRKCPRCGAVEFPPVIACNTCSCTDLEWVEMTGYAKMTDFMLAGILSFKPETQELMPYALACVEMAEGSAFNAIVCGVSKKNKDELLGKLPVPVKAKILQRDGYKTIVFDLA